ncbi:predicted protein [Streptomyces iranensis]|uniref:Uncharacterized protein n=1 Tax=Streptomyces iranensis TaxID=576784 RepID=A0A060ZJE4_9ACTN|nr:predicted protein [Streptomyces iranensis]
MRAGLLVFRAARMGLLLVALTALPVPAVWLCFASNPAP